MDKKSIYRIIWTIFVVVTTSFISYGLGYKEGRIWFADDYNCFEKANISGNYSGIGVYNGTKDIFSNISSGGKLRLSSDLSSMPSKVIFMMDEVEFVDTTINLTWTSKLNQTNGFTFDFTNYDTLEWNVNNKTFVYKKEGLNY